MTVKIGLLNPDMGHYEFFDDIESAKARFVQLSQEFFLKHTHGQPFSQVTMNTDGSQSWASLDYKTL